MPSNLRNEDVYTKRRRIAGLAATSPEMGFTSLNHLIDVDWLKEAFRLTRKSGAPGVDGQTAQEYEANLEENLRALLQRAKSGTVSGSARPAEAYSEGVGHGDSSDRYSDVRGQSAPTRRRDALGADLRARLPRRVVRVSSRDAPRMTRWTRCRKETMRIGGGWILEVDLRKFFDTLDHAHLREFVSRRIRDGVVRRLIGKWLKAGVHGGRERQLPGLRQPARRGDFTHPCERLPALCVGRMVRGSRQTASGGTAQS